MNQFIGQIQPITIWQSLFYISDTQSLLYWHMHVPKHCSAYVCTCVRFIISFHYVTITFNVHSTNINPSLWKTILLIQLRLNFEYFMKTCIHNNLPKKRGLLYHKNVLNKIGPCMRQNKFSDPVQGLGCRLLWYADCKIIGDILHMQII